MVASVDIKTDQADHYVEVEPGLRIHKENLGDDKRPGIYDLDRLRLKWRVLPDYVRQARGDENPRYDKIVLDKWGRKDVASNQYNETPEMVFFRAAMSVAEGLVKNDPSLDFDATVRRVFEKFINKEIFPNTPYMANSAHSLAAKYYRDRILAIKDQVPEKRLEAVLNDLDQEEKQKAQLFACFVLEMYDSRDSIFDTMSRASEIQAGTGGTGFNFSNLRPANESVRGTGGITDGPVSFMSAYSKVLGLTINQGGKRDGANMFMLDYNHPDIMRFVYAKRRDGEIPAANISIGVFHEFFNAVRSDGEAQFYPLVNPHHNPKERPQVSRYYTVEQLKKAVATQRMNRKTRLSLLLADNGTDILSPWLAEGMDENDRVIGKVGDNGVIYLDAKKVMKHIAYGSWFNGEPGIIDLGHINDGNPTHPRHFFEALKERGEFDQFIKEKGLEGLSLDEIVELSVKQEGIFPIGVGVIKATNPCGEKPLLPYEACVLGHVNLEKILDVKSNGDYEINWARLAENTILMMDILDNAIDQNKFTDSKIEATQKSNRKIGLGFMGLANMLYNLEIPYNSQEGRDLVEKIWSYMAEVSDKRSTERAEKFGEFPNFRHSSLRHRKPMRNAIRRTIAPTGTTGFVAQTTGGCEPEYALTYTRTTVQGTEIKLINQILEEKIKKYPIFFGEKDKEEFIDFLENAGRGSMQGFTVKRKEGEGEEQFRARSRSLERLKRIFVTTYDISPEDHLKMQAVVQRYTDDAISKTTNFRANAVPDDIEEAFILAHDLGIKGTTFYRDGTRFGQPLEVKGTKKMLDGNNLEDLIRERLMMPRPDKVEGPTPKMHTPFGKAFFTFNFDKTDPNNPKPYETFIRIGEIGGDLTATMDGFAIVLSAALRAGVPIEYLIEKLEGIGGKTQIVVDGKWIRSLPDAVSHQLKKIAEEYKIGEKKDGKEKMIVEKMSYNLCPQCGGPMRLSEGCEICMKCSITRC